MAKHDNTTTPSALSRRALLAAAGAAALVSPSAVSATPPAMEDPVIALYRIWLDLGNRMQQAYDRATDIHESIPKEILSPVVMVEGMDPKRRCHYEIRSARSIAEYVSSHMADALRRSQASNDRSRQVELINEANAQAADFERRANSLLAQALRRQDDALRASGYLDADAEAESLHEQRHEVQRQIMRTPARSLAGISAKLKVALDDPDNVDSKEVTLVVADIERLAAA